MMTEPDGYAVVMKGGDGFIVGAYREYEAAQLVCEKQPAGHRDVIVPIYFGQPLDRPSQTGE